MLKILQVRLQQYMNWAFPNIKAGLRKGRGTRDQITNICWIIEKENSRKISTSALLTTPKLLTVVYHQTTWPASWEVCMQVKKQQLDLDMKKTDTFQIGKGVRQGCILSPCLFNFYAEYIIRNTEKKKKETLDWKKHKLESRLLGEISITSDMQMTPPLWQKVKKN